MCGKTLLGAIPASEHRPFISAQICRRDTRLPLLVMKTSPEAIFSFWAYFSSLRHNLADSRIVRILPFNEISARPRRAASTVIYRTSLTLIPVAAIVSISRASRSRPWLRAVSTSRSYSCRLSSLAGSRNIRRWSRRNLTRHSVQPVKRKNAFSAASMEFTVTGAYPSVRRFSFHPAAASFVIGSPFSHREKERRSRRYFSRVPGLRSSACRYPPKAAACCRVT